MKQFLLLITLPVVLLVWGRTAFYAVDYTEYAYITRFGEPVVIRPSNANPINGEWPVPSFRQRSSRTRIRPTEQTQTIVK